METHERLVWARTSGGRYRSAAEAARAIGVATPTYSGHENGSRGLTPSSAERYARFYQVATEWLLYGKGEPRKGEAAPTSAPANSNSAGDVLLPPPGEEEPARMPGNRDVEVRGISVGGGEEDGDFSFNGEVVDYVSRPAGILRRKGVFVVRAVNDSMAPAYEPGDPLFVDGLQGPGVGDYVIVELFPAIEGQAGPAFVKRLVRRSGSTVVVRQFNPDREIEFERSRIKHLWRVIPNRELYG